MFKLFPAVFESVWKRKETKIYLSFAFIFLAVYFVSTFIPNTNFLQFHSTDGSKAYFYGMLGMLYSLNDTFPELALIYLTYTVFRKEVDDHVFFLYKDINRRQIILAKFLSLLTLILIFVGLFSLTALVVYYGRVAYMDWATPQFYSLADLGLDSYQFLSAILQSVIYVFVTAFLSMRMKVGPVVVLGFTTSILVALFSAIGSPLAYLFPAGYNQLSWKIATLPLAFSAGIAIVLMYVFVFGYLTVRKFDKIEF